MFNDANNMTLRPQKWCFHLSICVLSWSKNMSPLQTNGCWVYQEQCILKIQIVIIFIYLFCWKRITRCTLPLFLKFIFNLKHEIPRSTFPLFWMQNYIYFEKCILKIQIVIICIHLFCWKRITRSTLPLFLKQIYIYFETSNNIENKIFSIRNQTRKQIELFGNTVYQIN
jgi:hypothetical protein